MLSANILSIWRKRFAAVPLYCANETSMGVDEIDEWNDFTHIETTDDQKRIESYLVPRAVEDTTLLHVGIGNSGLAQKFCGSVSMVIGITIQKNEADHASTLGINNYFPMEMNKYSLSFANAFASEFDFILDNNPSGFSCCFVHFLRMMTSYRRLISGRRGQIVTDRVGLGWVVTHGNPRWRFDFTDWSEIAHALGMEASDVDGDIYTMKLGT